MTLPIPLYSAAQLRELDRRAIEQYRIPGAELMARAGAAAFRAVQIRFPRARRIAVICGPGNNGGDGYVIARLAKEAGLDVAVHTMGKAAEQGDAAAMRSRCLAAGVRMMAFDPSALSSAELIVDALLGIGLTRAVEGEWRDAIQSINASGCPIVAIDVPSGLNADTGAVMGAAVRAAVTCTFIGLKAGLFTSDGGDHAGDIVFDDLGVPPETYNGMTPSARRLTARELRALVPPRSRNANKGDFGRVLVVGGGRGMPGAVHLCGEAALRAGAGLVTLATHPSHATTVNVARPELLAYGVRGARDLKALVERASVIALGPGLSQEPWARTLWGAVLATDGPLVVDADGLNLLARSPRKKKDWILTPHPGEAARLLKTDTGAIQRDRFAAAREIVKRFGGVCVLKGAGTLVASTDSIWLCDRGNPGMASAGMGDVLTGVIAALCAQGLASIDAARLGVWLHAMAGDDAAGAAPTGLIASDLHPYLRRRLNGLTNDDAAI